MGKKALLCGINDYKSVLDLKGCVADVHNMQNLLQHTLGFHPNDITVLLNQDVTRKKLRSAWKSLMSGATEGDTLLFHFSGHGTFKVDEEGEDDDGNDEMFCLWDMDFNNPKTYLLDDDLDKWIKEKPDGVKLIVVTDCCHSGTITRMLLMPGSFGAEPKLVDVEATEFLANDRGLGGVRAIENFAITPRFLPPPELLLGNSRAIDRRRKRPRALAREYDHLHLAACRDDQTAKDAPINTQYNGAFTYHFCQAVRSNPEITTFELQSKLDAALVGNPYAQNPQIHGAPSSGPLFAWDRGPRVQTPEADVPGATTGTAPDQSTSTQPTPIGTSNRDMLIQTLRDVAFLLRNESAPASRDVDSETRKLVYVHGIDEHPGDYSLPWFQAMTPFLGGLYGAGNLNQSRFGVHWSNLVNARAFASTGDHDQMESFRLQMMYEIEQRNEGYGADPRSIGSRGGGPQFDDFLLYLLRPSVRSAILQRFYEVVRPRLSAGETIDLITHSWGTVVAYEGLLQLDAEHLPGKVKNLFTVGSALSISTVRWKLGLRNVKPQSVQRWFNVAAKGDGIGGSLKAYFPVTEDYQQLEPTGCERGWLGYSLGCAHSSYFNPNNLVVNRDIFAKHLLEA
ncbi:caspase domain-containing protein [Rhodopirellula sp. MGV]|uniref:caspase family protein n=1 Tax=Rhodopirellula sp. MGV TaxID=2023130 RepID=UPI0013047773|nr:caspase family protein [Rhodopirellula sp. MGV]